MPDSAAAEREGRGELDRDDIDRIYGREVNKEKEVAGNSWRLAAIP